MEWKEETGRRPVARQTMEVWCRKAARICAFSRLIKCLDHLSNHLLCWQPSGSWTLVTPSPLVPCNLIGHLPWLLPVPFSPSLFLFPTFYLPHLVAWFVFSFAIVHTSYFLPFCTLGTWLIWENEVNISLIFVKCFTYTDISEALENLPKHLQNISVNWNNVKD